MDTAGSIYIFVVCVYNSNKEVINLRENNGHVGGARRRARGWS